MRNTGAIHFRLEGNSAVAQSYIPLARTLHGITKQIHGRSPYEPLVAPTLHPSVTTKDLDPIYEDRAFLQDIFGDLLGSLEIDGVRETDHINRNRGWDKRMFQTEGPLFAPPDARKTWRFVNDAKETVTITCLAEIDIDRVIIHVTGGEEVIVKEEEEPESYVFILMVLPSMFGIAVLQNEDSYLDYNHWWNEMWYATDQPIESFRWGGQCLPGCGTEMTGRPCDLYFGCSQQYSSPAIWMSAPWAAGFLPSLGSSALSESFGVESAPYVVWATGDDGYTLVDTVCEEYEDVWSFTLTIDSVEDWPDDPSQVTPPTSQQTKTGTWDFCFQTDKCGEYTAKRIAEGWDCSLYFPPLGVEITEPWQFGVMVYNFWGPGIHWLGFPCEGSTLPDIDTAEGIGTCLLPWVAGGGGLPGPVGRCVYYMVNDFQEENFEGTSAGRNIAQIGDCNSRLVGSITNYQYVENAGRLGSMPDQCLCHDLLWEEMLHKPTELQIPTQRIIRAGDGRDEQMTRITEGLIALSMNPNPEMYESVTEEQYWNIKHYYTSDCVREGIRRTVQRCWAAPATRRVAIIPWMWTHLGEVYAEELAPFVAAGGRVVLVAGIVPEEDEISGRYLMYRHDPTVQCDCEVVPASEQREAAHALAKWIAGDAGNDSPSILLDDEENRTRIFRWGRVYLAETWNESGSNQFSYTLPNVDAMRFWPIIHRDITQ